MTPTPSQLQNALARALNEARRFEGATAPNPPVGATALDENGEILSIGAHQKAGTHHAEARVLEDLRMRNLLSRLHTMVVTLEPCNHHGKTPPCTEALIQAGVKQVVYGTLDPNPRVAGAGVSRLARAGITATQTDSKELAHECAELIRTFGKAITTGRPWVTVKQAINTQGTMIPPKGSKTFTSPAALKLAHELRRRADAILTGSGTILADEPEFTVRHVPDIPGKTRWLVIMDRRKRVPTRYIQQAESRGFKVLIQSSITEALDFLGKSGCLEVLVEAGPELTGLLLNSSSWPGFGRSLWPTLWDEHVVIEQAQTPEGIEEKIHVHRNHPKDSAR